MSQQTVIEALNRLIANQCYSLVNYLSEAPPWTRPGNEELMEATRDIVQGHEHYVQRLADAIEDRRGVLEVGRFPMRFLSLNDLALDYLLVRLIEDQRSNIQVAEQCTAELVEDPQAWSLASEVLGSERAHLDILKEFLPPTEPTLNGDEIGSLAA
jgi:hypothetical protein